MGSAALRVSYAELVADPATLMVTRAGLATSHAGLVTGRATLFASRAQHVERSMSCGTGRARPLVRNEGRADQTD